MAVIIRGHYWPTGDLPPQIRGRRAAPHPARGSVFQLYASRVARV